MMRWVIVVAASIFVASGGFCIDDDEPVEEPSATGSYVSLWSTGATADAKKRGALPLAAISKVPVLVNFGALRAARLREIPGLAFPLPDGSCVAGLVKRVVSHGSGEYVVIGTLGAGGGGSFLISVKGEVMVGTLRTASGGHFSVRTETGGGIVLHELDDTQYPPCAGGMDRSPGDDSHGPVAEGDEAMMSRAAGPARFDVLVVYTSAARAAVGGTAAMQALINLAVEESNTIYSNSLINAQIRLVHDEEVAYSATGFATALEDLTGTSDGNMDNVHTLRDTYGADLVCLFINVASSCGLAWRMTQLTESFESGAFSVVYWDCATGYYSFAHELAHNMGSHHAVGDAGLTRGGSILYPYSYGWRFNGNADRTVMAYSPGTRRMYFSNPDVLYNGHATGVAIGDADEAHNVMSINNAALTVSNWRDEVFDLSVTPDVAFRSVGSQGGPFSPSCQEYVLSNGTAAAVSWSAISTQTWVTLSSAGGSLSAGQSVTLTACVNSVALSLPAGLHTDTITVTNITTGVQQQRVVELQAHSFASLPFSDGFEDGYFREQWVLTGTEQWRSQVTPGDIPYAGTYHMVMEDWMGDSVYSRNEVTLGVNLNNRTNVNLSFHAKELGDESHGPPSTPFVNGADFDGVAISVDRTNWYEVASLRGLSDTYSAISVDLDSVMASNGLEYSATSLIRFNQYDNFATPADGISIDNVAITGTLTGPVDLTIVSAYDGVVPGTGTHTYVAGDEVTCQVTNSPFMLSDPTRSALMVCTGWVGTGSAPVMGMTTNTGAFFLETESSSVTWLWAVSNLWLSNETVMTAVAERAINAITAGDGFIIDDVGDVTLEAGRQVRLQSGFSAQSGSVFRALIDP